MKRIVSVSLGSSKRDTSDQVSLAGETFQIERIGTDGSVERARDLVASLDGRCDAIGLSAMNIFFRVAGVTYQHEEIKRVAAAATKTPVVDGANLKSTMERWAVKWVANHYAGTFTGKAIFVIPGVDRYQMALVLEQYTKRISYGDLMFHKGIPWRLRSRRQLELYARHMMPKLMKRPYAEIYPVGRKQEGRRPAFEKAFRQADVVAGDFGFIKRYAPENLSGKTVITNYLSADDLEDMKRRRVKMVITTMPDLGSGHSWPANVVEAIFVTLIGKPAAAITPDDHLGVIAETGVEPRVLFPQGRAADRHTFAFVIHPLSVAHIFKHPLLRYLKFLPNRLVERAVARMPAMYLSKVTGIKTAAGVEVEGHLLGLGATPRELMRRPPEFTYKRLVQAAGIAEKLGAPIMGLGAFTSVVGDAGITVAKESDIAITSGNSYTIASTIETATRVARKMGADPATAKVVVIGATGSIGNACARLLARSSHELTLVAPRPEKLLELKEIIAKESDATVTIGTKADTYVGDADIVVTTTTAMGKKVVDVMKLKPGCVVCDVARPPDITAEDAARRQDILVIESGEILVPGEPDFHFDIGLPPRTAYACLSETIILAAEGVYESYTLGRNLDIDKIERIKAMGDRHGFDLAGIRSFDRFVTDDDIERIRKRAMERRKELARSGAVSPQTTKEAGNDQQSRSEEETS